MPNPTLTDLHVATPLVDVSVAFEQADSRFIARRMFPIVPVQKRGDKYFVWDRQDFLRSDAQEREPGTDAPISGPRVSTDSYFARRFALARLITDADRANADPAVANLDADATQYLMQQMLLRDEKDFVTKWFTTGIWNGASSSTDMTGQAAPATTTSNFKQWNNVDSTPIEDIRGEQTEIVSNTGQLANAWAMGARVWTVLADHPDIVDRIKYGASPAAPAAVTQQALAALLGVDQVLISWAAEDSGVEGSSGGTFDFVAGKNALLAFRPASAGLRTPTAGYTFVWTGLPGAPRNGQGARILRFRRPEKQSDQIESEVFRDQKVVSSVLGAFFTAAVA